MSDRMTPMPFGQMIRWILKEKKEQGTVFGVYHPYRAADQYSRQIFGRKLETTVGPAAGPQLPITEAAVSSS